MKDLRWVSFAGFEGLPPGFRFLVAYSILLKQRLKLVPFFCGALLFYADSLWTAVCFLCAMACSLKTGLSVSGLKDRLCYSNSSGVSGISTSVCASSLKVSKQPGFPVLSVDFLGNPVVISDRNGIRNSNAKAPNRLTVYVSLFFFSLSFLNIPSLIVTVSSVMFWL